MKVGFNARLLHDPSLRGWNRYTIDLLIELANLGIELFLYSNRPLDDSHLKKLPPGSYQVKIAPPMAYFWWEQYWLPKQCAQDNVDILHCPFNFGLPWFSSCLRVLTLHDAIDQIYYDVNRTWQQKFNLAYLQNQLYHWIARHRANLIITVSEYSKQDLIKYLNIPETKIAVIYEAADRNFHRDLSELDRAQAQEKHQLSLPYIFYIGGWETRKNIPFLVRAFAEANLPGVELVLAGGKDEQRDSLLQLADSLGISDRIRLLGWIEEEDLPALYAGAMAFVYPSEYEGFGLQLCEAMAVGCPVLAANATCLPEVLGDGGELFSLAENSTELVDLLRHVSHDRSYYLDLVHKAKHRSQNFDWQNTALETKSIYQKYLSKSKSD
jgi:glycosyltransferase involved in cell wall biosynthesis